jgi:hypothetical protein
MQLDNTQAKNLRSFLESRVYTKRIKDVKNKVGTQGISTSALVELHMTK